MFQGINWRRIFVDFGWAMAVADPLCYSYYLAYRAQGTGSGERATLANLAPLPTGLSSGIVQSSKPFVRSSARNA